MVIKVIHNDNYSFSVLLIINDDIIHITQNSWMVWERPIIYDMIWKKEYIELVRPIAQKLMNRVGTKEKVYIEGA